jgi:hypothetical protein
MVKNTNLMLLIATYTFETFDKTKSTLWNKIKKEYSLSTRTYLLTPWSRVFLEKLTGFQQVKKFPAF